MFCQTGIQNIWWTGLPLFVMDEEKSLYYLPYVVLVASLLFLAVMCGRWKESEVKSGKSGVMTLCVQVIGKACSDARSSRSSRTAKS